MDYDQDDDGSGSDGETEIEYTDYRDATPIAEIELTSDEVAYHKKSLDLLRMKGVYCYTFFDDFKKLEMQKLPDIAKFRNDLADEDCKVKDYERAIQIYKHFGIKNLKEYTQLYLASDVLILADIFQMFRKTSMSIYGLDPGKFFTAGSLAITAAIKTSNRSIQLLTDANMYLQFEAGLRVLILRFC